MKVLFKIHFNASIESTPLSKVEFLLKMAFINPVFFLIKSVPGNKTMDTISLVLFYSIDFYATSHRNSMK